MCREKHEKHEKHTFTRLIPPTDGGEAEVLRVITPPCFGHEYLFRRRDGSSNSGQLPGYLFSVPGGAIPKSPHLRVSIPLLAIPEGTSAPWTRIVEGLLDVSNK